MRSNRPVCRSLVTRALTLALLPAVLVLAVAGQGYATLVCRATGMVHQLDCCPAAAADTSTVPRTAKLTSGSCCDLVRVDLVRQPAIRGADADPAPPPLAGPAPRIALAATDALSARAATIPADPDAPPPPLVLLKHALLI